jgi:hypothetical protein
MRFFAMLLTIVCISSLLDGRDYLFEAKIRELGNNAKVSDDSLYVLLKKWDDFPEPEAINQPFIRYNTVDDSLQAPFVYVIPESYDPRQKSSVLIYLHGGVSRPEYVDVQGYAESLLEGNPFAISANKTDRIFLTPLGNIDTAWWNPSGIANILQQVRYLKKRYNINDDRIYLTGFSDGGSASYHFSMLEPNLFASFYPLSGNMLVGYAVTATPAFTANMRNRFVRAVNTDKDGLYPAARMRLMIETAQLSGANLSYSEYWDIGHEYSYGDADLPLMLTDMEKRIRDPFQPYLYWETSDVRWGRCDWIEITELDTMRVLQNWQHQPTTELADDRVFFGFRDNTQYEGRGVEIESITPGSVSEEMGLENGDVIIAMDNQETDTIDSLLSIRNTKERGDSFSLIVIRDGEQKSLPGQFPPVTYTKVFDYDQFSGAIKAYYRANHFDLKTSGVSELALYISPEMINPRIPVKVTIDNIEVFYDTIFIDREFMINGFVREFDRSAIWTNRLTFSVPE